MKGFTNKKAHKLTYKSWFFKSNNLIMFQINGLPTLILYKNKEIVNKLNGGRSLESLVTIVNEHLQDKADETTAEERDKGEQEQTAKDEL